jgi:anti-anti-sigma factor
MPTRVPVYVHHAIHDSQLYLAFEGAASHRVSLAIEHLAADFLDHHPSKPEVVLDLAACSFLDSTFAGWMIMLQKRVKQAGGRVVVSRSSEPCRSNLPMLGLTSLFEFAAVPPPGPTERMACDDDATDAEAIEVMLHAHEDLAAVNADNERVFTPIADTLRRELQKRN